MPAMRVSSSTFVRLVSPVGERAMTLPSLPFRGTTYVLYAVRLISGTFMLLASLDWFVDATAVLGQSKPVSTNFVQEQTV